MEALRPSVRPKRKANGTGKMFDQAMEKKITEKLAQDGRILAAYLLGSAVSGRMRPDSDIDLGVLIAPGRSFTDLDRLQLTSELTFDLGLPLDIGEISSRNLIYAKEAIFTGRRIFVRDRTAADLKVSTLLGMYLVFNEDRKEVLDAYRAG
jgi:uncharacterized protein